ncbi:MAG: type II toxin-antitoxin system HicB family antitoxin, partial [Acidaminococcaceae bacterium]|nr:type II toxin-antitoxin system HicB family antitoxin [Acidaminococcaceae bacterium]
MKAAYTAILTPRESGSGYFCRVPDLPGCISEGNDLPEAVEMIEDAANLWLVGNEAEAPTPTPQSSFSIPR